jgi:hypothetical protein
MSKNIDFCIPYISSGIKSLEYLIGNLIVTTTKLNRLRIIISYHNDNELKILESSSAFKYIYKTIHAPIVENDNILFKPSYNHSVAINSLLQAVESEIVIISDSDMAFLKYGWDEIIQYNLDYNYEIIGACYANYEFGMPINNKYMPFKKYQNLPNLSFFCTKKKIIKDFFNNRLTYFDEYLLEGSVPFRFINTKKLSAENNLPLGTLQWLDTGYEIPETIYKNKISCITLNFDYNQTIFPLDEKINLLSRPEVFLFPISKIPFLAHFKKTSSKLKEDHLNNEVIKNFDRVSNYLKDLV